MEKQEFIILVVKKPSTMTTGNMIYKSWRKAIELNMALEFEISSTHMTYRIDPDTNSSEIQILAEQANKLDALYEQKK